MPFAFNCLSEPFSIWELSFTAFDVIECTGGDWTCAFRVWGLRFRVVQGLEFRGSRFRVVQDLGLRGSRFRVVQGLGFRGSRFRVVQGLGFWGLKRKERGWELLAYLALHFTFDVESTPGRQ